MFWLRVGLIVVFGVLFGVVVGFGVWFCILVVSGLDVLDIGVIGVGVGMILCLIDGGVFIDWCNVFISLFFSFVVRFCFRLVDVDGWVVGWDCLFSDGVVVGCCLVGIGKFRLLFVIGEWLSVLVVMFLMVLREGMVGYFGCWMVCIKLLLFEYLDDFRVFVLLINFMWGLVDCFVIGLMVVVLLRLLFVLVGCVGVLLKFGLICLMVGLEVVGVLVLKLFKVVK